MNHHPNTTGSHRVPTGSGPTPTDWVPDPLPLRGGTQSGDPLNPVTRSQPPGPSHHTPQPPAGTPPAAGLMRPVVSLDPDAISPTDLKLADLASLLERAGLLRVALRAVGAVHLLDGPIDLEDPEVADALRRYLALQDAEAEAWATVARHAVAAVGAHLATLATDRTADHMNHTPNGDPS